MLLRVLTTLRRHVLKVCRTAFRRNFSGFRLKPVLRTMFKRLFSSFSPGWIFIVLGTVIPTNAFCDVIHFDELQLNQNSFFDGYGSNATSGSWNSSAAEFNTNQFGPGWSYSNVNDTTTAGFLNQWAAFTGTGVGGSGNYAIANSFSDNGAFFNLANLSNIKSVFVTNTTFAALAMRDGDSYSKQFGGVSGNDPDFFTVRLTGFSSENAMGEETGAVDVALADFRFADNTKDFILDEWKQVDLSTLGTVRSIGISFDGSDVGTFGLNTPAYVAFDEIRFQSVPEPGALGIFLLSATFFGLVSRKRPKDLYKHEALASEHSTAGHCDTSTSPCPHQP